MEEILEREQFGDYLDKIVKGKRHYYWKDIGTNIRIEMLLNSFGFGVGFINDRDLPHGRMFHITIGIFNIVIFW